MESTARLLFLLFVKGAVCPWREDRLKQAESRWRQAGQSKHDVQGLLMNLLGSHFVGHLAPKRVLAWRSRARSSLLTLLPIQLLLLLLLLRLRFDEGHQWGFDLYLAERREE